MVMSSAQLGLVVGLILGVAGAFGGFGAFLITLVLGVVGLLVGRWLDGTLDLTNLGEQVGMTGRDRGGRL